MKTHIWRCHYCLESLSLEALRRNRMCPSCSSEFHSCLNCTHFDAEGEKCREPDSPWVTKRDRHNECPYFEFRSSTPTSQAVRSTGASNEVEAAKAAFRALFREMG